MDNEDIITPNEEPQNPSEPDTTLDAEREIEGLEVSGGEAGGTLGDAEGSAEHETDLQRAMRYLRPTYKDPRFDELMQSAMASRIFPDNYLAKINFTSIMLIEEQEGEPDIDVMGIINKTQDAHSIGYEGRYRGEIIELAGVAHEEEMEKLSKELGLAG